MPIRGEAVEWLKNQVKFDGFLEEMGEEVLEDVLNLTLGTNDEERSLENYVNAIFKSPEEWAVIAGVIGLQGGTLSVAGNLLADAMQRSGKSFEEIQKVIDNSTENEKYDLISGLQEDSTIQSSDLTDEERTRQREIKEDIYFKLKKVGIKDEEANNLAILTGSIFAKYGTKNKESRKIFDKYINNLVTKYNIPADVNGNQYVEDNPNIYYQSVYHGTPHRFDEFSLDAIGTGEGAQAHGWGLYFAGNKNVSEGYRKTLSQPLKNAKYDGIPLYKTELSKLHSVISEKLYLKGKDEALKELNRLKEQSEKNKDKDGFLGRSSRESLESYKDKIAVSGGMRAEWKEFYHDSLICIELGH